MCGIVIRIRRDDDVYESKNKLIAMLEDMLSTEESAIKKQTLESKYGMIMTEELERRVDEMCNLSTAIEEKSIEKGIIALVNTLKDLKQSNEYIIGAIIKQFGLSETEAKKYV